MIRKLLFLALCCFASVSYGVTLCGNYDAVTIGTYRINNNVWNDVAGSQCITYATPSTQFTVSPSNHNKPTNGAPAAYPFTFKGCHWGVCTPSSGLPRQLSTLTNVYGTWQTTQNITGIYNKAFDIWFNTTPTATGQPNAHELMIWLHRQGGIQPIGSKIASYVMINSVPWDVWTDGFTTSYVRVNNTYLIAHASLKSFMSDAVARGLISPSWYLISVEAGFEIWQGGNGLGSSNFLVSIS